MSRTLKVWLCTACIFVSFIAMSQTISRINVHDNQDNSLQIKENSPHVLKLNLKIGEISWVEVKTPKGRFIDLAIDGFSKNHANYGSPHLPVMVKLIEMPYCDDFEVVITRKNERTIDLNDEGIRHRIMPTQPSYSKSTDPESIVFSYDEEAYSTDAFSAGGNVEVQEVGTMRGTRIGKVLFYPFSYNPVKNHLQVATDIEIEIRYRNSNVLLGEQKKKTQYSPAFEPAFSRLINYQPAANKDAITAYPITYVIVSPRIFEASLQPFVSWKTKKGFKVIEAYTDVIGTTTTAIKAYLENLYNTESPKPSYLLIVGDVAQVPAFSGTTGTHVSDLYYCTYDGADDYIPEVYYGRFSAENLTELNAITNKTLMHEQYLWPDDSFLDQCVLVAGVDNSYAARHGNGQIYYAVNEYFNQDNGYENIYAYFYGASSHPYHVMSSNTSPAGADIRERISKGVGLANYTAHCTANGWGDPAFTRAQISDLNNYGKYPVMISNCCLPNKFNDNDCFGEMVVYAEDKGAVSHIGASNNTMWDEDFYWSVGINTLAITAANAQNHNYGNTQAGAYDGLWHTHGQDYSEWFITNAAMIFTGNMSVENSSSTRNKYYWEVYHVMGDPSLKPYLSVPTALNVSYNQPASVGISSLVVNTEPYAYVAISIDGVLLDAAYSWDNTSVTLNFPEVNIDCIADIVVTKQNRKPYIGTLEIMAHDYDYDAATAEILSPKGNYHISESTLMSAVRIRNNSQTTLTSVTVNYYINNGSVQSLNWTGSLLTNQSDTVYFPEHSFQPGFHTITAYTSLPNGQPDEFTVNDTLSASFTVYNGNGAVTEILVPLTQYCSEEQIRPAFVFTNADSFPLTSLNLGYIVEGRPPVYRFWTGSLQPGEKDTVKFSIISPEIGSHSFTAFCFSPNGGIDLSKANDSLKTHFYMASGLPLPFSEGFEGNTFPPEGWKVINPDNNITWIRAASTGNGTSTASASVKSKDYANRGQIDELHTPVFDLYTHGSAKLTFNVAYRQYSSSYAERLQVFVSTDCGASFHAQPIYDKTGAALATLAPSTAAFVPSHESHWRKETVDLTEYTQNGVVLKFVCVNDYGNNLYIDDINIEYIYEAPVARLMSSIEATCNGWVQFYDMSDNGPMNWFWDFGDGNSSTLRNPSHHYATNGTYSVTLSVSNINGAHDTIYTDLITVNLPDPPMANHADNCGEGLFTLTATSDGQIFWYNSLSSDNLIETGTEYQVYLTETDTFYVESYIEHPVLQVGNANIDTYGGTNTGVSHMIFDVYEPLRLISVEVNNTLAGNKIIYLRDGNGIELRADTFFAVPLGISRLELNYDLTTGSNYQLGSASNCRLWRNNSQINYPYEINDLISITGSSGGANYYYYFYNWEVKRQPDCRSNRVPVIATVDNPKQVSISISAAKLTICPGENLDFYADALNAGDNPQYEWFINDVSQGVNTETFSTSALQDADSVYCLLTTDAICVTNSAATSNIIHINVLDYQVVDIQITTSAEDTICIDQTLSFTAIATNSGMNPVYQWQVNGEDAGSNTAEFSVFGLETGDVVQCILTSSSNCAYNNPDTSNAISFYVLDGTGASVSITASKSEICVSESISFTATPEQGGGSPLFQWYINDNMVFEGDSVFATSDLQENDRVFCIMTSSELCAQPVSSQDILVQVNQPQMPLVTITASDMSFCQGDSIVIIVEMLHEGTTPVLEWYLNGVPTGITDFVFASNSLQHYDIVSCKMTSNASCISQDVVFSNSLSFIQYPDADASFSYIENGLDYQFVSEFTGIISWQWNFGDTNTDTVQNPSHTYSENGIYTVTLITTGMCNSDTSSQTLEAIYTNNVSHLVAEVIQIHPNPAKAFLLIEGLGIPGDKLAVSIHDATGRQVFVSSYNLLAGKLSESISLQGMKAGIYMLHLRNDDVVKSFRFMVE